MACQLETEEVILKMYKKVSAKKDDNLMKQSFHKNDNLIHLPRGGVIVQTSIGNIQMGMPPETVKDSIILGLDIPTYYIIPSERFNRKVGIAVAEFEFPAYFNFFIKKRKINLICTKKAEEAIRIIF